MGINTHIGPLGVDIRAHAVGLVAKTVAHGVLDLQPGKVQRCERAVLRRYFHLNGLLGREPDLPRHLSSGAVEVLFAAVIGVGQLHQHPLRQAAVQVQAHGVAPRGLGHHTTAAGQQVFTLQAGQGVHFMCQKVFYASGAGEENLELVHRFSLLDPRSGSDLICCAVGC